MGVRQSANLGKRIAMRRKTKNNINPILNDKIIEIHTKMAGHLLRYMKPEEAFWAVEAYVDLLRSEYRPQSTLINKESIPGALREKPVKK